MAKISEALRFPGDFFALDEPPEFLDTSVSFRALTRMTARDRDEALGAGTLATEFAEWIEERFDLPDPQIPNYGELAPETAAEAVRAEWGLGVLAIPNMIHLLESRGAFVFSLADSRASVDAFSFWNNERPSIFLNTGKSAERGRYDSAHELGHLVLHEHGTPNGREAEAEAHAFASAFLMPRSAVLATASPNPSLRSVMAEKQAWGASAMAYVHRLHALQIMSDWTYHTLCQRMAALGYRKSEPDSRPHETSMLLRKVFDFLRRAGASKADVARGLRIPLEELEAMVFGLVLTSARNTAAIS